MKLLNYLTVLVLISGIMVSCSEEAMEDNAFLKGKKVEITEKVSSLPVSDEGVTPFLIPGENNGGNRTCAEVGLEFADDADYFALCGEKIDYDDGKFMGNFPDGLNVTTDGKYVSFEMGDCLLIGDSYYKVGAVIVKGSNQANVYFYPDGAMSDYGLAAPINSSGGPAGLSNLTFCFVECQMPELVVGFKSYTSNGIVKSFVTSGNYITSYPFVLGGSYTLYYYDWAIFDPKFEIGYLKITDSDADGHWEVTVDNTLNPSVQFIKPFLYVGTAADFNLDYENYPYPVIKEYIVPTNTWTFELQ